MTTKRHTESLLYALAAALLLALAWLISQKDLPAFLSGSFFVQQRAAILSAMLAIYAVLLVACALAAYYVARKGFSFSLLALAQVRAALAALRETGAFMAACCKERLDILFVLLALALGIGLRGFFLAQPMRLDESYTFLYYLNLGRDPFNYVIPNNHVLHTLLAWLSVAAGGMGPVALRFPAFLAGVLSIPVMFCVCRAFDRSSGLLAAFAMALLPYMVLYSTTARGYSLLVLLSLFLLLLGRRYLDAPSLAGCLLISLVSALGMLTLPTMLFLLAGFYLWIALALLIRDRDARHLLRNFILPCAVFTVILTVILYTPTVISSNGPQAIFSNRFVDSHSWKDFLAHLYPHYREILSDFSRDVPRPVEYGLVLLVLLGLFAAWRRRDWPALLVLPAIVVGGLLVLFAKHVIPFVRTWIYLIPFALLFADLGYSYLLDKLRPAFRAIPTAAVFLAGLIFAGYLVSTNAIAAYPDTGTFPEASVVAEYLTPLMTGDEYIVVRDPANYSTFYYLCYDGAPPQNPAIDPATAKRYFITQKGQQALSDLTDQPATPLFEYGDALIYTATGGPPPSFPGYTFDCRSTRK